MVDVCDDIDGSKAWEMKLRQWLQESAIAERVQDAVRPMYPVMVARYGCREHDLDQIVLAAEQNMTAKLTALNLNTAYAVKFATAINLYTMEDPPLYKLVNSALNSPNMSDELTLCRRFIKLLDSALGELPFEFKYGGEAHTTNHNPSGHLLAGQHLSWKSFMSATTDAPQNSEALAGEAGLPTIIQVNAPSGAYCIDAFSAHNNNGHQLLFRLLSQLEVTTAENHSGVCPTAMLRRSDMPDTAAASCSPCAAQPLRIMCEQHDEKLKLWCDDCNIAICSDCTVIDHKHCNFEFCKKKLAEHQHAIEELAASAKVHQEKAEEAAKEIEQCTATLEQQRLLAHTDEQQHSSSLVEAVLQWSLRMCEEIDTAAGCQQEALVAHLSTARAALSQGEAIHSLASTAVSVGGQQPHLALELELEARRKLTKAQESATPALLSECLALSNLPFNCGELAAACGAVRQQLALSGQELGIMAKERDAAQVCAGSADRELLEANAEIEALRAQLAQSSQDMSAAAADRDAARLQAAEHKTTRRQVGRAERELVGVRAELEATRQLLTQSGQDLSAARLRADDVEGKLAATCPEVDAMCHQLVQPILEAASDSVVDDDAVKLQPSCVESQEQLSVSGRDSGAKVSESGIARFQAHIERESAAAGTNLGRWGMQPDSDEDCYDFLRDLVPEMRFKASDSDASLESGTTRGTAVADQDEDDDDDDDDNTFHYDGDAKVAGDNSGTPDAATVEPTLKREDLECATGEAAIIQLEEKLTVSARAQKAHDRAINTATQRRDKSEKDIAQAEYTVAGLREQEKRCKSQVPSSSMRQSWEAKLRGIEEKRELAEQMLLSFKAELKIEQQKEEASREARRRGIQDFRATFQTLEQLRGSQDQGQQVRKKSKEPSATPICPSSPANKSRFGRHLSVSNMPSSRPTTPADARPSLKTSDHCEVSPRGVSKTDQICRARKLSTAGVSPRHEAPARVTQVRRAPSPPEQAVRQGPVPMPRARSPSASRVFASGF